MSIIASAPPAAPIEINSTDIHLFMAANVVSPEVCYLALPASTGLELTLLHVTATGTVKPNQAGDLTIGLFAHVTEPNVDPPQDNAGDWVMLGQSAAEPVGGTGELGETSWMVQGLNLMFNPASGKMQGTFQSNVADNPVFPDNLNTNPNGIRDDVSPLMLFAVGAMFTPTADDGSTPVLTLAHFTLNGEV